MKLDHRRSVRNGEKAESVRDARFVHRHFGVHVQRRRALVEHRVERLPIAVLFVPFEVPEEAAELEALLLPETELVAPVAHEVEVQREAPKDLTKL